MKRKEMEKVQYYMQCTDKTLVLFVDYRLCITVYTKVMYGLVNLQRLLLQTPPSLRRS